MKRWTRLLEYLKSSALGSIRRQLMWAFGLLSLLMLWLAGYLLYAHQRDFLYRQGERNAANLTYSLAVSSSSWLVARDMAGLQEVTAGFATTPDLKFAAIVSRRGEVLASSRGEQIGKYFSDAVSRRMLEAPADSQVLISQPALIDVVAPIMSGNRHVGWARIEMTQDAANRHLRELALAGLIFATAAVVVVVWVSVLMAGRLTRRLGQLVRLAEGVGQGQEALRSQVGGSDEIGVLAHGFDRMLDALAVQQADLAYRNAELALYNRVLQRIGQRESLQAVAIKLATQVEALRSGMKCAILVLEDDVLRLLAGPSLSPAMRAALANLPVSTGPGTSVQAVRTHRRAVSADVRRDPAWSPLAEQAQQTAVLACWAQPILDKTQRVLGVFTLYSGEPGEPTPVHVELLERCAGLAGLAIERQHQDADLRVAATAFETQESVIILDAQRRMLRVNHAFSRTFGYAPEEVLGRPVAQIRSNRQPPAFYADIWDIVARLGTWQGEVWYRRRNGEVFPTWVSLTSVHDEAGQVSHHVATMFDITSQKQAEDEIRQLAYYDPLTELPNRRLLMDQLRHALATARRTQRRGALLFLDLDNFKAINDTLGHDKGDALLHQVADRLTHTVRESDTVARLGGDEFVIMLTELAAEPLAAAREAERVAGKLLAALREPYDLGGVSHHNTGSIGVTLLGVDESPADEVFKQADLALHQAKAAGRDSYRFFDPAMQANVSERVALERDLRLGLQAKQFQLHFQPQVDGVGQMIGAEVLVRWRHPQRGMVSPATFIPLAEESGLILPLGRWVLEQACRQLVRWAEQPQTARLTLAVNVSSRQTRQADFVNGVLAVLAQTGANPARLKLELTESLLLDNVTDTIAKMGELKARGVGFSLDDFGTGYSSLAYLKRLPLDQLKIDQSFVRDALSDPHDAAIVRAIVALGHSLQLQVIAEGVETSEQREFLAQQGCHHCQGFLFGRPGPVESLAPFLPPPGFNPASSAADR
jgi:diguanylate cyclase (GGDEF)-like protein/PAS domain S-box-containing protein